MLSQEQISQIKKQLFGQIQHLPEDQKNKAQAQIDALSPEAVELMLKRQSTAQKGVFRMIVDKEIKSYILEENSEALAVLDINPISKGHTIVIPKKPVLDQKLIPESVFSLANEIATRMSEELKAESTEIKAETKFGEVIINIIPSYEKPLNISSPRSPAEESELEEIASKLKPAIKLKPTPQIIKKEEKKPVSEDQILKLKRRIP